MTVEKLQKIQDLIKQSEIKTAQAEGAIQEIKKDWKDKYGTDNPEELNQLLERWKEEISEKQERLNSMLEKLESAYDWEELEEELKE